MARWKRFVVGVLLLSTVACGGLRHVAVQVDATFAESVFALSDASYEACVAQVFTPEQCKVNGSVNTLMKRLIIDVDAITAALQDANVEKLPNSVPDLLMALKSFQRIVIDISPAVQGRAELLAKIDVALTQAINLLNAFVEVAS